jgi:hypothetical protein
MRAQLAFDRDLRNESETVPFDPDRKVRTIQRKRN